MYITYLGLGLTAAIAAASPAVQDARPQGESPLPVCEAPGWFCPSPGTTGFCNKHNRYVDGSVCPTNTCCALLADGTAACTEEACDDYPPEPQAAGLRFSDNKPWGAEDEPSPDTEKVDRFDPLNPLPKQCDVTGWFCPTRISAGFCDNAAQITKTTFCDRGQCCGISLGGKVGCSFAACRRYNQWEAIKGVGGDGDDGSGGDGLVEDEDKPLDYCQLWRKPGWSCPHERVAVFCNEDHEEADGFGCDDGWCCTMSEYGKASCTQEACYMPPSITLRDDGEAGPLPTKGPLDGILRRRWSSNSSEPGTASPAGPQTGATVDGKLFPMLNSTDTAAHGNVASTVGVNVTTALDNGTRLQNSSSYPPFFQHEADDDCIIGEVRCYHNDHGAPPGRQGDAKSHIEVCNGSHKWMTVEVCEEPEKRCEMVAENNAKCVKVHW